MTFAKVYQWHKWQLLFGRDAKVDFACRGLKMARELAGVNAKMEIDPKGVSICSHRTSRVVPIRFVLAELCYILAGRGDVASIASYNKSMAHYSDDGTTIGGSYGLRLKYQLPMLIQRLKDDVYTRQACATIYDEMDCLDVTKTHQPCNVFMQFLCRPPFLDLHVTSRSSDFVTGFSIDTLHWQALLIMMANELSFPHQAVLPTELHYDIGSLHIYEADIAMVEAWKPVLDRSYEHFLPLSITLSAAIENCKKFFKEGLSLRQLAAILDIHHDAVLKLEELDELFRQYKNVLVR